MKTEWRNQKNPEVDWIEKALISILHWHHAIHVKVNAGMMLGAS
jgi:hypothetical protein